MKKNIVIILFLLASWQLSAQVVPLTVDGLNPVNIVLKDTVYKGKKAIRITGKPGYKTGSEMAVVRNIDFINGTIEADVSGDRQPGTDTTYRGFVGIAFRVQDNAGGERYECFYLRPTNGRAEDQLRRNHSVQYISEPEYPWEKLRKENPGVYESYADMVAGEWTHIKITVKDHSARLFVNHADQPCLIVNDLKHDITGGPVALWIGIGTEAYFNGLSIHKE